MKIVTSAQMRQAEEQCGRSGLSMDMLMENAGRAVAEAIERILGNTGRNILVLVGPGNNGGDGLVAARCLRTSGWSVTLYLLAERSVADRNLALAREAAVPIMLAVEDASLVHFEECLASADAVLDAVFGTGKVRPLNGAPLETLKRVAQAKSVRPGLQVIALDLPSGLDADTGAVDPACLQADYTITLGLPKSGLFNLPGAGMAGRLEVADIGMPNECAPGVHRELASVDLVRSILPKRPLIANKGMFGKVMVVAGSPSFVGAAYLACSGAMRAGAGLVTLAIAGSLHPILASKLTEATHLPLPELSPGTNAPAGAALVRRALDGYDVMLVGCGLGHGRAETLFVKSLLLGPVGLSARIVVDADALNILSGTRDWWRRLPGDAILTPHPGEMARLTGLDLEKIQSDRLGVTEEAARNWGKTVVLKGAYTVIAAPDGRVNVSPFANPGLASAGTGDVLAGVIAGLVAQGMPLFEAATCGVYLHGKAGEMVRDMLGDAGMMASDVLPFVPRAIKAIGQG